MQCIGVDTVYNGVVIAFACVMYIDNIIYIYTMQGTIVLCAFYIRVWVCTCLCVSV